MWSNDSLRSTMYPPLVGNLLVYSTVNCLAWPSTTAVAVRTGLVEVEAAAAAEAAEACCCCWSDVCCRKSTCMEPDNQRVQTRAVDLPAGTGPDRIAARHNLHCIYHQASHLSKHGWSLTKTDTRYRSSSQTAAHRYQLSRRYQHNPQILCSPALCQNGQVQAPRNLTLGCTALTVHAIQAQRPYCLLWSLQV